MKKLLLSMAMLLAGGAAAMADDTMTVTLSSTETPVVFNIDKIKEIVFTTEGFTVVDSEDNSTPFEFTTETSITFDYTPGGDTPVEPDGIAKIQNSTDGEIEIFDLSGRRLEKPSKGVYIVKTGNKTFKVVNK